jgi:hypothetical protein
MAVQGACPFNGLMELREAATGVQRWAPLDLRDKEGCPWAGRTE